MTIEQMKELSDRIGALQKENAHLRAQLEYIFFTFHGGQVITFSDDVVNEMAAELGYPSPIEDWSGYSKAFNDRARRQHLAGIVGD